MRPAANAVKAERSRIRHAWTALYHIVPSPRTVAGKLDSGKHKFRRTGRLPMLFQVVKQALHFPIFFLCEYNPQKRKDQNSEKQDLLFHRRSLQMRVAV